MQLDLAPEPIGEIGEAPAQLRRGGLAGHFGAEDVLLIDQVEDGLVRLPDLRVLAQQRLGGHTLSLQPAPPLVQTKPIDQAPQRLWIVRWPVRSLVHRNRRAG